MEAEGVVISGLDSKPSESQLWTDHPVVKHSSSCCGLKINNIPVVPLKATSGPAAHSPGCPVTQEASRSAQPTGAHKATALKFLCP